MTVQQWEMMPESEQEHRLLLFLAEKQAEREQMERASSARFDAEMEQAVRDEANRH